jgi:uncharacterized glyoxalase superfamily protein PhnB
MIAHSLSPCITTDKVEESKAFYMKHFNARVVFDCGWYVDLEFGKPTSLLQFMAPQQPGQPTINSAGLTYNFAVDDVDQEYSKLMDAGLTPVMPLDDHPWGDRGFAIQDPNGITLYIYTETEPTEEYKQYFK